MNLGKMHVEDRAYLNVIDLGISIDGAKKTHSCPCHSHIFARFSYLRYENV